MSEAARQLFADGTAAFSPCPRCVTVVDPVTGRCAQCGAKALYRYALARGSGPRTIAIMGVNPSTATAEENDATIRRDMGFARALGFGRLLKLNLFGWRDKNVRALLAVDDPVGPENDAVIAREVAGAHLFVAAWGAKSGRLGKLVNARAVAALAAVRCDVYALRLTDGGHPEHTLFLPGNLRPVLYRARAA